MDSLYLPYLMANDTLDLAKKRMIESDSRGIVVEQNNTYKLHKNSDIRDALKQQYVLCSEINSPGLSAILLNSWQTTTAQWPNIGNLQTLGQALEAIFTAELDKHKVSYGVLYPPDLSVSKRMALVITRHEERRDYIAKAKKVCLCSPNKHEAESPPEEHGKQCQDCWDGKYECF